MPDTAAGVRWVPDEEGQAALLDGLAHAFDGWVEVVEQRIKEVERGIEHYHFADRTYRYVDTIHHATYFNGELIGGIPVRGAVQRDSPIYARVYTASVRGHMLEVTGAVEHRIRTHAEKLAGVPKNQGSIVHPGFHARPHFQPGLLMAVSEVGATMKGRFNTRASAPGAHPAARTFVSVE